MDASSPRDAETGARAELDRAAASLRRLRRALETGDAAAVAAALEEHAALEPRLVGLEAALRGGENGRVVLERLRALRAEAFVCARLAASQAAYLDWARSLHRPAPAYTARGTLAPAAPAHRAAWEA